VCFRIENPIAFPIYPSEAERFYVEPAHDFVPDIC